MKSKILILINVIEFLIWTSLLSLILFANNNFQDILGVLSNPTIAIERKIHLLRNPFCFLVGMITFGFTSVTLIKKDVEKLNNVSKWMNILVLLILLIELVYSITGNESMIKKMMHVELLFSVFILVLPCWWNLKVLKRLSS
jgi:hypothetical protein